MSNNQIGDNNNFRDVNSSIVNIRPKYYSNRFAAFLVVVVLLLILAVIMLPLLQVTPQDIYSTINPPKLSTKEQISRRIWGTYTDEQHHTWIFSPNQMFNMDGTIYIDGQPSVGYRII